MFEELRRLLESYDFLRRAVAEHGDRFPPSTLQTLIADRDKVFLEALNFVSRDRHVTMAQIHFQLSALACLARDPVQAEILRQGCAAAVARLGDLVQANGREERGGKADGATPVSVPASVPLAFAGLTPREVEILDSMSDRVAIIDASGCYVFTNKANAAFHGMPAADFVGRHYRNVVGDKCYQTTSRELLQASLGGRAVSIRTSQQRGDRRLKCEFTFQPITGAGDSVTGVLLIGRTLKSRRTVDPTQRSVHAA